MPILNLPLAILLIANQYIATKSYTINITLKKPSGLLKMLSTPEIKSARFNYTPNSSSISYLSNHKQLERQFGFGLLIAGGGYVFDVDALFGRDRTVFCRHGGGLPVQVNLR